MEKNEDGRIVRAARWLETRRIDVAQNFSPILLAGYSVWLGWWLTKRHESWEAQADPSWTYWVSAWTPWVGLVVLAISVYGGLGGALEGRRREQKIAQLQRDNRKGDVARAELEDAQQAVTSLHWEHHETLYQCISDCLAQLMPPDLRTDDTVRVSLYIHDDNRFALAGRYTINPKYKSVNRKFFPDKEGVIGKAWAEGGKYQAEFPDDEEEMYTELRANYRMTKQTASSLSMPSRTYCGFAVSNKNERKGVLLFESTRKGVLALDELERNFETHESYLENLLQRFRPVYERVRVGLEGTSNGQA